MKVGLKTLGSNLLGPRKDFAERNPTAFDLELRRCCTISPKRRLQHDLLPIFNRVIFWQFVPHQSKPDREVGRRVDFIKRKLNLSGPLALGEVLALELDAFRTFKGVPLQLAVFDIWRDCDGYQKTIPRSFIGGSVL